MSHSLYLLLLKSVDMISCIQICIDFAFATLLACDIHPKGERPLVLLALLLLALPLVLTLQKLLLLPELGERSHQLPAVTFRSYPLMLYCEPHLVAWWVFWFPFAHYVFCLTQEATICILQACLKPFLLAVHQQD